MSGYYYHYTTYEGKMGIQESGYIKPSIVGTRDAVLGEGVYFTELPPTTDKEELLYNNYGPTGRHQEGKIEYCVKISKSQLNNVRCKRMPGRTIFCYPGKVNLRDYDFEIVDVATGEVLDTSSWAWVTKVAVGAAAVGLGALVLGGLAYWLSSDDDKEKKMKK